MALERFLKKFKYPLLRHLSNDNDFNLVLPYNHNIVSTKKTIEPPLSLKNIKQRRITKKELLDFIEQCGSVDREAYLSENYIYTLDDINFLKEHSKSFITYKYALQDISRARGVIWSDELLENYKKDLHWTNLSSNNSILWDSQRTIRFKQYIDFSALSYNTNLEIDINLINKFENKWNWRALSGNPTLAKIIEKDLLLHNHAIWKTTPDLHYGTNIQSLNNLYISKYKDTYDIEPCISTNPEINWDLKKFLVHSSKLDLWLLLLFGNIEKEVLFEVGESINENRILGIRSTKYSDWYDSHPIYRNGWENYFLNKKTTIDLQTLKYLQKRCATLIAHDGDASTGHTPYNVNLPLINLIEPTSLIISFRELFSNFDLLPQQIISEINIDENIYLRTIKPEFISNGDLLNKFLKIFRE